MKISNNTVHLVLTRFNVRISNSRGDKNIDPEWLKGRFRIFEAVCLPALVAQTMQPDRWLVFFDERTPEEFGQQLQMLQIQYPPFTPVFCSQFSVQMARAAILKHLPADASWLVTTRLDSDDAIHPQLIGSVMAEVTEGRREFLNPTQGLVISGDRFYRKRDFSGPFISLSEPVQGFESIWTGQHHLLARYGPIRQIGLRDAWLQVVHGGNVANQVRGVRASSASIDASTLPASLAQRLRPESAVELALDNSLGLLSRYARSAFRFARTKLNTLRSRRADM